MSRLVVMGSGETAPTMVRVHREVFAACPPGPAVMLDTPFAFQTNRAELVTRTCGYFAQSLGREVEVAVWSGSDGSAQEEKSLALLDRASWAFAGPGSPTYALRRWRGTPVPAALTGVVRRGGTVVLGSAAALTLGTHAVPVYEIYKVGEDPQWVEGLDLLGTLTGVDAAVVPHYDNKEGATHDTRFCYLGEDRLAALEEQLPDHVGVLGVDEHTAFIVDVEARTITVAGNGVMSVRRRGDTRTFAAGESLGLDELSAMLRGEQVGDVAAATPQRRRTRCRAGRRRASPRSRCGPRPTGRAPSSTRRWPGATWTAASPRCSGSSRRWPPGRPTPCRATTPTRPAGCCGRWWCGWASWRSREQPTRRSGWRRSSRRCSRCALRLARRRTSRPPTWCVTGWSMPASRCGTAPTVRRGA